MLHIMCTAQSQITSFCNASPTMGYVLFQSIQHPEWHQHQKKIGKYSFYLLGEVFQHQGQEAIQCHSTTTWEEVRLIHIIPMDLILADNWKQTKDTPLGLLAILQFWAPSCLSIFVNLCQSSCLIHWYLIHQWRWYTISNSLLLFSLWCTFF